MIDPGHREGKKEKLAVADTASKTQQETNSDYASTSTFIFIHGYCNDVADLSADAAIPPLRLFLQARRK